MTRIISAAAGLVIIGACATVDPRCEQEIDACLERCEASGGHEAAHENIVPEVSTSYCEDRCKCRESTTPSAPPASTPPTYTGTAKP